MSPLRPFVFCCLLLSAPRLWCSELVVLVDRAADMPMSRIEDGRLTAILGYQHPEIEAILGAGFVRDNSPNMKTNFEKLARGRVHHILSARGVLDYRQRLRAAPLKLHPPLTAATFETRCAVSRRGHLSLADANRAIAAAARDGTLARIMDQFR